MFAHSSQHCNLSDADAAVLLATQAVGSANNSSSSRALSIAVPSPVRKPQLSSIDEDDDDEDGALTETDEERIKARKAAAAAPAADQVCNNCDTSSTRIAASYVPCIRRDAVACHFCRSASSFSPPSFSFSVQADNSRVWFSGVYC
jgi:hypothetical protein